MQIGKLQSAVFSSHHSLLSLKLSCQEVFVIMKFLPVGYNIIRKDRKAGGGGVLLAIDNGIATKPLSFPIMSK